MRLLIDREYFDLLPAKSKCKILHDYPQQILLECLEIPQNLHLHSWRRVDNLPVIVNGIAVDLEDGKFEFGDYPRTLLKFIGPIDSLWLQTLKANDVRIIFICPSFGICAHVPRRLRRDNFAGLFPFLCSASPYLGLHCSRGIAHEQKKMRKGGLPADACDLVFFSREDRARISEKLKHQSIEILDTSNYKLRIRYQHSLTQLRDINGVKLVDYSRPSQLCANDDLNTVIARPTTTLNGSELRGQDQVIAVADTGLDSGTNDTSLHPDFQGRVKAILSLPLNKSWHEVAKDEDSDDGPADRHSGHGTHVAGLALGNGIRSNGLHQGVAPESQLVFQAIEQYVSIKNEYSDEIKSGYYLSGRPLDLNELFGQARELGAHIHVNAWGDDARGQYTDDCYEADQYLSKHPDALIIFAAGNSGADRDGNRILDTGSLYSPASAKNVLAVGATEGGKEDIGLRVNWGAFDSRNSRFRSRIDRADPVSGNAAHIALFSSTGPSKDGRIKPDVCAPGTNLVAPRSRSTSAKGWGLASPLPYYMYNGGTSMAAGVAGGAAAILREAWEKHTNQPPSGQALKALLILSTSPVFNRKNNLPEPSHVAGFGRIQISRALPQTEQQNITLIDEQHRGLFSGEQREYNITVNQNGDFCAVLSWYDPPGEALINNLNLYLVTPTGERIWGNHSPGENGQPDTVNNVEKISISNLEAGRYLLRVSAVNVPLGPQGFALAISKPSGNGLQLPLVLLRGIGSKANKHFEAAGIHNIGQLLSRPERINEIPGIGRSLQQQLHARIAVLSQVQEAVSNINLDSDDIKIMKLIDGKLAGEISGDTRQLLREQCLPLILVFNRGALSKITLQMLRS